MYCVYSAVWYIWSVCMVYGVCIASIMYSKSLLILYTPSFTCQISEWEDLTGAAELRYDKSSNN